MLVGYHPDTSPRDRTSFRNTYRLELVRTHASIDVESVRVSRGIDVLAMLELIDRDPRVAFVEPDWVVKPALHDLQWNFYNFGQRGGTEDADVDGPEAWAITSDCSGVVVAIIDTGIDIDHVDLADNIWYNPGESADASANGIDDDENGFVDDYCGWNFRDDNNEPFDVIGHGTHIAGIIGAQGRTDYEVVGVCSDVEMMSIKAMGMQMGFTSDVVAGIDYAVRKGADIINASFTSGRTSQALERVLVMAFEHGIMLVAAAGNDGMDLDGAGGFPAWTAIDLEAYSNLITVAATDRYDMLADYSNYGFNSVHLAAPGSSIYSTWPDDEYWSTSGTSMAVPHVSGAVAMLIAARPDLSPEQIRTLLMDSIDPLEDLAPVVISGGRLNLHSMLLDLEALE